MGEWERQPQNDTPMRLREGSLGIREVVGKSVVGESRIGGRMELGGSWEELSSQSVETWEAAWLWLDRGKVQQAKGTMAGWRLWEMV